MDKSTALIVGAGNGLSSSLARLLHKNRYHIALVARDVAKLHSLSNALDASLYQCDATQIESVDEVFSKLDKPLRVAVCNPSSGPRGPITDLDPKIVEDAIAVTAFASFLVAQQAARIMLKQEPVNGCRGTILFTGASAGVKGFPQSAPFAMGKFAQRGLAQSLSRELHPQGVHVCWINIDGGISNDQRGRPQSADNPNALLDPDAIAQTYLSIIEQHPSAWSSELAVRPWVEPF